MLTRTQLTPRGYRRLLCAGRKWTQPGYCGAEKLYPSCHDIDLARYFWFVTQHTRLRQQALNKLLKTWASKRPTIVPISHSLWELA